MRHESRLSSVLDGWTLQLRRAQWQVDGRGCRPEVVKLVADGLGLLVAGQDPAGAARLQGVSWNDYLRTSLRTSAAFGHVGHELQAEVVDGTAHLVALADRMPWTISRIHVDPKRGTLLGVTQDGVHRDDRPQIPASQLAWHAREREGIAWQGRSLLRASYPAWLLKREMLRTNSIAHRRWAAGIPVAQARPGSNPSPGQMAEAQRMASAARAGDVAGVAMPQDFELVIQGIAGQLPDTLGFIRFLNQEIAGAALMPHLDLGTSQSGSRALGESFIDSWTLALEAWATETADVATRQIAARIVEWNFGSDEPVPSVVVSGIGSRREVTSESLNSLLSSGALSADPALEAWIRREWRLPERDPDAPKPLNATGVDLAKPDSTADGEQGDDWGLLDDEAAVPVKAAQRSRRRSNPDQMSLFGDGHPVQAAARPETPEQIQAQWEAARAELLAAWPKTAAPLVTELAAQAETAVADGDLPRLGQLAASAGVIAAQAAMLGKGGTKLARQAAAGVVAEAAAHDVIVRAGDAGAAKVNATAEAVAHIIAAGYASGAGRIALQHAGADPESVRDAVERHLDALSTAQRGMVADQLGALLSAAQHAGRLSVLERAPKGTTFRASEWADEKRCDACDAVHGKTYRTLRAALIDYPASGYRNCEGGPGRCRGHIAADWTAKAR
ncbi:hypothetical protein J2S42_008360 [Catenuloplanes indicus]|uniref:Uncharacterized protein n=1 Tax=Catenuloplanes indicus TaxID=137267 RepID=A0AAE4B2F6_9ACTN|nr:hypothetical protein [Catenuloplanes indicus]MDQ0371599.1 hypothetical protein [Catenuloplanes indicus]MDQ0371612.1 hypothetical protein [Catenuloplanes indicus]